MSGDVVACFWASARNCEFAHRVTVELHVPRDPEAVEYWQWVFEWLSHRFSLFSHCFSLFDQQTCAFHSCLRFGCGILFDDVLPLANSGIPSGCPLRFDFAAQRAGEMKNAKFGCVTR
jgi:hypothetical protein